MWQMGWGHPGQVSALQGTLCCLFDMVLLCDLSLKSTHKKDLLAKMTLNMKLCTVKSPIKTWIQNICSRNILFCYLSLLVKVKFLQLYGFVWEWLEKGGQWSYVLLKTSIILDSEVVIPLQSVPMYPLLIFPQWNLM